MLLLKGYECSNNMVNSVFMSKLLVLLILVAGSGVTYILQRQAVNVAHQAHKDNFEYQSKEIKLRIEQRLLSYEQVLLGTKALFVSSEYVDRDEFRRYVKNLHLESHSPGIQGVGYSLIIKPSEKSRHIEGLRKQGFSDYTIHPEGSRDIYTAVLYLEPFTGRNLRAFGYDMFLDDVRHKAMEQARDFDKSAISGKVILLQETEQGLQSGFLMYLPVYRNGHYHRTLEERRANIIGWVYAPFRMDDLMQGILGEQLHKINIQIYDTEQTSPETLMYNKKCEYLQSEVDIPQYSFSEKIKFNGHIWTINLKSLPIFEANIDTGRVTMIRLAGGLTTILVALLTALLANGRSRALKLAELMTRESNTFEYAPIGIINIALDTRYIAVNQTYCCLLDYAPDELLAMTLMDMTPSQDSTAIAYSIQRMLKGEITSFCRETQLIRKDNSLVFCSLSVRLNYRADGSPHYFIATVENISERKQYEDKLRLAASVFTHAREGIMITDREGKIVDVNTTFSQITGYNHDEVIGKTPRILSSGRHDKDFYAVMWRNLTEKGHWYGEIWNRHKSGEIYAEMQNISAVCDAEGETQHYVSLFSDITLIKGHEQKLEHIAHYDPLTNLPNRVLLADRLQQAMHQVQRHGQQLAVVFLDLDGFKAINDNFGHKAGDQLLMNVALSMKEALRETDTLARLGGDEFVAVLTDLPDIETSIPMLNRLLSAAAKPLQIADFVLEVSASLGATSYPQTDEIDADQLLRQADQAMYQAKLAGKNRYHIFDPAQDSSIRVHHESLERIRKAIIEQEFLLFYQPKVNMRTGAIIGVEALLRWKHPEKGLLLPATFLPTIEDHLLAIELGDWVISTALTQIRLWRTQGLDIPVSVNIGARHIQQSNFLLRLYEILASYPDIKPSYLELEVLETSALEDIAKSSLLIAECREIGINFVLDDFGTGYSSLTYLKRLPVALLKIDQSFVCNMLDDSEDLAIIDAVIGLARTFGRQVIAEGVESEEHGLKLLQHGCELAQGYGVAYPMSADQILSWSSTWKPYPSWVQQPKLIQSH
jgi:diguanylate cyclase (GGDEF)-like protein/PAS domain S-box-containing protein